MEGLVEDGLEEFESVLAFEGREAGDHFVNDASETPPVYAFAVSLFLDHFGGEVLGGPANRHRLFVLVEQGLAQSEVGHLDVPAAVEQHVLGFEAG